MDSLLASYASSDDEAPPAPAPAPSSAATRGGEAAAKPAASSASSFGGGGGGGIFSSLPQPKPTPLFTSLPAPKPGPTFSTIPAPKSSTNPKRVVQYRPQPIRQPTGDSSDDDEEDDAKKRRAEARPAVFAGSGPVSSFLPPPKHSLGLGAGSGAGTRRSAIDATAPERPGLGAAVPSSTVSSTEVLERTETGDAAADDGSEDSGSEDGMPVPDQEYNEEQLGSDAGPVQQPQQQCYDTAPGSTSGYEAYAWDPNYYAQYGTSYGLDPDGNANYATGEQYAAYGGEQGGGYAHPHGGEHVGGYANVATAPYGADYTGGYVHEAVTSTTFPAVQDPVLPPVMGRIGGKRGRNDMPTEIVEVNQEELMKNRPKQDKSKLTGLAFGPSYQPAPSAKGKPSKLHKRKHQIGSLYHDMKSKEMELAERRSKGILTKAETQAKYGW